MASSDQAGVQQLFPPPPYYFIQFVPDPDGTAERPLPPLPPPCVEGTYQMFGELHTTEDGLPQLQVQRLYQTDPNGNIDFKQQFQALHQELVVNFLELLNVLVEKPSGYARQVENFGVVMRNLMNLTNQLRPYQAQETIRIALEKILEEQQQATAELSQAGDKVTEVVNELRRQIEAEMDILKQEISALQ